MLPWHQWIEKYPYKYYCVRCVEGMRRASIRYRHSMLGYVEPKQEILAALRLAARNAIYAEGLGTTEMEALTDAVIALSKYDHLYDRPEEQLAIIRPFYKKCLIWFSTHFGKRA